MHSAFGELVCSDPGLIMFFFLRTSIGTTHANLTNQFTQRVSLDSNVGLGKAPANGVEHPTRAAEHTSPSQKENANTPKWLKPRATVALEPRAWYGGARTYLAWPDKKRKSKPKAQC